MGLRVQEMVDRADHWEADWIAEPTRMRSGWAARVRLDADGAGPKHWGREPRPGDSIAVLTRRSARDFGGIITEVLDPEVPIVATTRPPYATQEDGATLEGEREAVEADRQKEYTAATQLADLVRARQAAGVCTVCGEPPDDCACVRQIRRDLEEQEQRRQQAAAQRAERKRRAEEAARRRQERKDRRAREDAIMAATSLEDVLAAVDASRGYMARGPEDGVPGVGARLGIDYRRLYAWFRREDWGEQVDECRRSHGWRRLSMFANTDQWQKWYPPGEGPEWEWQS